MENTTTTNKAFHEKNIFDCSSANAALSFPGRSIKVDPVRGMS